MQRNTVLDEHALLVDGNLITDTDEKIYAWANYFRSLGNSPEANEKDTLLEAMRELASSDSVGELKITTDTVEEAIKALKRSKAPDCYGIVAEQMKMLTYSHVVILTAIIKNIFEERQIPSNLKKSYKFTIPKKNKDPKSQDNHRGITITPLISKIIELIIRGPNYEVEDMIPQNDLQFGFTPDECPEMAIVCINEAISEAEINDESLDTASLDARKAFDLVNQAKLKKKLFHTKLPKQSWAVIDSMYTNCNETFKLSGRFSDNYTVMRGVRQGSILSPLLYKDYIFDLLFCLSDNEIGLKIGTLFLGTPTVADDVFLMSNSTPELQSMLNLCFLYSEDHDYTLNIDKSLSCPLRLKKYLPPVESKSPLYLGHEELKEENSFTHLGLVWSAGQRYPDVQKKISSARRAAYALFGSGLHGVNGLGLSAALNLFQIFVVPILLYGLNAVSLPKNEMEKMEAFFRNTIRQLQGLPKSTAKIAVYLLAGTIPLEGLLHKRCLGLFGQITRLRNDHPLRLLALRQLSLRDEKSGSWFPYINSIASKYGLNILMLLNHPMKKSQWKSYCDNTIEQYWNSHMINTGQEMSSLKHFIFNLPVKMHGVWTSCRGNSHLVDKASVRARMLCRRHTCGDSPWMKQPCSLCGHVIDDEIHILAGCPKIESNESRINKIRLFSLFVQENLPTPSSPEEIAKTILNGDCFISDNEVIKLKKNNKEAHTIASVICYDMNKKRDLLLSNEDSDNFPDDSSPIHDIPNTDLDATIPYEVKDLTPNPDLDATIPYSTEY